MNVQQTNVQEIEVICRDMIILFTVLENAWKEFLEEMTSKIKF